VLTLLIFIAVLAVLVLSHEFGHFIVARKNGIQVDEFGFGFPPRLIGIRKIQYAGKKKWQIIWSKRELVETLEHEHVGTIYSINLIPLGGFVKIKGENGSEPDAKDPDSFFSKKTWQKIAVISAGVIMNFLLAGILLGIGFMVGMPQIGEDYVGPDSKLQVIQVVPGMPADKAGIKTGAVLLELSGLTERLATPNVTNFREFVNNHKNEDLLLKYDQEGKEYSVTLRPEVFVGSDRAGFGVGIANIGTIRYPWYRALYEGFVTAVSYLGMIFRGLWTLISQLFAGKSLEGQVAGPVGVAVMTGEAARLGIVYLLQFTALLSLNLAAVNILPIPALDGGRLLFIIISKITRKEVPPRIEQLIHMVGFALLMSLVIFITFKDVQAYGGGFISWWKNLIRL
jgi:regulator of sigma E protease